jgi:AraC-type transcriptional regulator
MPELTIGAGFARGLMELAVSKGAGRQTLVERSQIDLEDQDNRIPFAKYVALMRAGKELCNDPALGLHYGEAFRLSDLSIAGLICDAAPTMDEAIAQVNRYGRLAIEVEGVGTGDRFKLARDGSRAHSSAGPDPARG